MVEARNALADLKKSDADAIANKNFDKIWPKSLFKVKPVEEIESFNDEKYEDDFSDDGFDDGGFPGSDDLGGKCDEQWPPDCSFIPDAKERQICEQCTS